MYFGILKNHLLSMSVLSFMFTPKHVFMCNKVENTRHGSILLGSMKHPRIFKRGLNFYWVKHLLYKGKIQKLEFILLKHFKNE